MKAGIFFHTYKVFFNHKSILNREDLAFGKAEGKKIHSPLPQRGRRLLEKWCVKHSACPFDLVLSPKTSTPTNTRTSKGYSHRILQIISRTSTTKGSSIKKSISKQLAMSFRLWVPSSQPVRRRTRANRFPGFPRNSLVGMACSTTLVERGRFYILLQEGKTAGLGLQL